MIRTCSGRDICQTNDQSSIKETYSLWMGEAWHFRPGHGFPWYFRVIRFTPWYFFVMIIARCMIFCCHELCIIILWRCMIFPCECWSAHCTLVREKVCSSCSDLCIMQSLVYKAVYLYTVLYCSKICIHYSTEVLFCTIQYCSDHFVQCSTTTYFYTTQY